MNKHLPIRITPDEYSSRLVKALGMEGQNVLKVEIHIEVGQPPSVRIERLLAEQELKKITELFEIVKKDV